MFLFFRVLFDWVFDLPLLYRLFLASLFLMVLLRGFF